jgi:assimilatory nitrate reductase catalytic subunit
MSYEMMEAKGGIQWPCNEQFPNGSPRLYTPDIAFCTTDGKAKLLPLEWIPLQEPTGEQFPLILNTGRTVEQWHTRTKTRDIGILNDLAPEAWVDINPSDAAALKVKSGDRLSISSPRGRVDNIVVRVTNTVREGDVFVPFHFNTQLINQLTASSFCPKSGEPNFKQTAVQLHSSKVPAGIVMKSPKISGEIEHHDKKVFKTHDNTPTKEEIVLL